MSTVLKIQVFRHAAAPSLFNQHVLVEPEPNASVRLIKRVDVGNSSWPHETLSVTHHHDHKGFYNPDHIEDGEWLLVVTHPAASPVVQRLTMTAAKKGHVVRVRAGWDGASSSQAAAATVTFIGLDQMPGGAKTTEARHRVVQVELHPRREAVLLVGFGYKSEDLNWTTVGEGRRNYLYKSKAIDKGSLVTVFDCQTRMRHVFVKARAHSKWLAVASFGVPNSDPKEKRPMDKVEITILHLYDHLETVGAAHPGTVIEASILSHGWRDGPILFDTYDTAPSFQDRDPQDTDGRTKDWLPSGYVRAHCPNLPKAFHAESTFRIWGCVHRDRLIIAAKQARRRQLRRVSSGHDLARDDFFEVNYSDAQGAEKNFSGFELTTEEYLRREIVEQARGVHVNRHQEPKDVGERIVSYAGLAAQTELSIVSAAPPGMGSSFRRVDGDMLMFVDGTSAENRVPMAWYREEFAPWFVLNKFNYMDYGLFQRVDPGDPSWRTNRCRIESDVTGKAPWSELRLPSGMVVEAPGYRAFAKPAAHRRENVTGHIYLTTRGFEIEEVQLRGAIRWVKLTRDASMHLAFFVGKDGKTTALARPAGTTTWEPYPGRITVSPRKFNGHHDEEDDDWPKDTPSPEDIIGGVVDDVHPQWHW